MASLHATLPNVAVALLLLGRPDGFLLMVVLAHVDTLLLQLPMLLNGPFAALSLQQSLMVLSALYPALLTTLPTASGSSVRVKASSCDRKLAKLVDLPIPTLVELLTAFLKCSPKG